MSARATDAESRLAVIDRLKKLLGEATPAPWQSMRRGNAPVLDGTLVGQSLLTPVQRPYQTRWVGFQNDATAREWHHSTVLKDEDADLVAALRNHAPWLIEIAEKALASPPPDSVAAQAPAPQKALPPAHAEPGGSA